MKIEKLKTIASIAGVLIGGILIGYGFPKIFSNEKIPTFHTHEVSVDRAIELLQDDIFREYASMSKNPRISMSFYED